MQAALEELTRLDGENKFDRMFPDEGPLRRELYKKHMQFFEAGIEHQERGFMAANRIGKTWGAGAYETTCHLTGRYPAWWAGFRFQDPIDMWAAGDTGETTRDVVQHALLGPPGYHGTGMMPKKYIVGDPTPRRGVADAIDYFRVKHVSGGESYCAFKSYDQGRRKFQGTAKSLIWLDEEPPEDVYDECLVRLMTTGGRMMLTFTPLLGLSKIALRYRPDLAPEPTEAPQ